MRHPCITARASRQSGSTSQLTFVTVTRAGDLCG